MKAKVKKSEKKAPAKTSQAAYIDGLCAGHALAVQISNQFAALDGRRRKQK